MSKLKVLPNSLPCYPCPHNSCCCFYGSDLSLDEKEAIVLNFGSDTVLEVKPQEWRTRVVAGKCVFLSDNGCKLHSETYYPEVCRGFPWRDYKGGPYEGDLSICPELGE